MSSDDQKNPEQKILELIQEAITLDEELRVKYQIGEKFRFVRDRLKSISEQLESLQVSQNVTSGTSNRVSEANELLVYVYLYNAHGINIQSWKKMLTPKLFYEYSVNRPIYGEKGHIESLLRAKTNKMQHAFLEVFVKPEDVISGETQLKDVIGNPILKVKEGSLHFENLLALVHNGVSYRLSAEGELIKK